jgi:hypothetical protein
MTIRARGRPSLYREEYAEQARKLCLLGATDKELADFFEIDVRTVYDWRRTKPEFSQAIAHGNMLADAEVAAKLYERAYGYTHSAIKIYRADDGSVIRFRTRWSTRRTPRRPACGCATGSQSFGATSMRSRWPTPTRA